MPRDRILSTTRCLRRGGGDVWCRYGCGTWDCVGSDESRDESASVTTSGVGCCLDWNVSPEENGSCLDVVWWCSCCQMLGG